MAHKEKGFRFPNDWTEDNVGFHDRYEEMITIPVEVEIDAKNTVFNFHQVAEYLEKAHTFVVQDCYCRTERGNCDFPLNVCLRLDNAAERRIESPGLNSRQISKEEAVEVLMRAQEAGLVMMAFKSPDDKGFPKTICGCCSCCCGQLSGMLRFGLEDHTLQRSHVAVDDSNCVDCGECVDRCHFNARKKVDGKLVYDKERCFGCGLCTHTCPTSSISLQPLNN